MYENQKENNFTIDPKLGAYLVNNILAPSLTVSGGVPKLPHDL